MCSSEGRGGRGRGCGGGGGGRRCRVGGWSLGCPFWGWVEGLKGVWELRRLRGCEGASGFVDGVCRGQAGFIPESPPVSSAGYQ